MGKGEFSCLDIKAAGFEWSSKIEEANIFKSANQLHCEGKRYLPTHKLPCRRTGLKCTRFGQLRMSNVTCRLGNIVANRMTPLGRIS